MGYNYLIIALVFFPFAAGIVSYIIGRFHKTARDLFLYFALALELAGAGCLFATAGSADSFVWEGFASLGLHFKIDGFRMSMSVLASFIWLMTTLVSREYFKGTRNRNKYYMFVLFTLGAMQGVFLSNDLYTTFIFFEVMSFASYPMVIHNETKEAIDGSNSYLGFAVLGSLVSLMGLFMLQSILGTLQIDQLVEAASHVTNHALLYTAGALTLVGFGVKAGMYPLHTWLPQAHSVAPAPASAMLSAVITKAGIFGIIVVSCNIFLHDAQWGLAIVIFGTLSMVTGAVLAVFSNNIKRTLACSSVSQLGFVIIGIGMQCMLGEHNALAVRGTVLHMFNHSLLKLALFMGVGVIYVCMHTFDLNKLRGFGRKKPVLWFVFGMGLLGLAGVPLFNGYISKTLIHESIVEYIGMMPTQTILAGTLQTVEALFTFAGGLTLAYMLKLFVAIFIEKNPENQEKLDAKKKYMSKLTMTVLIIAGTILPIIGMLPYWTQDILANTAQGFMHGHDPATPVNYFSLINLRGAAASIAIGLIVYFLFIRVCLMKKDENGVKVYADVWPSWLSIEHMIYRPVLLRFLPFVGALIARAVYAIGDTVVLLCKKLLFVKSKDVFTPPTDHRFGTYEAPVKRKRDIPKSLSYSLLLFGVGVVIVMMYLIIINVT